MILQSLFLSKMKTFAGPFFDNDTEVCRLYRPAGFVLHKPSGYGFYVDVGHKVTISVSNCSPPETFKRHVEEWMFLRPFWCSDSADTDFSFYIF